MAEQTGARRAPALRLPSWLTSQGPGRKFLTVAKGDYVFRQGELADRLFFIREGRVRATVMSPTGKEATVGIFGQGDMFGFSCAVQGKARSVSACALVETELTSISRQTFFEALQRDPQFAEVAMDRIVHRLTLYEEALTHHIIENSERRLARALLQIAGYDGKAAKAIEGVTQEMLAAMVGTTRPRINGFMNKFRRLGYIDYSANRIVVNGSLVKILI